MTIAWTLRHKLAVEHHIFAASQLQEFLREKVGITIPLRELERLIGNDPPAYARIRTLQAICDALECSFSDFCNVTPDRTSPSPDSA
jgi:DNA-binding Xre family transcriptional regulator